MVKMSSAHARQFPVKRLFNGLQGSSFSVTTRIAPQAKPKNRPQELVRVHFCLDQEHGESKPDRCNCKLRVSKDRAYELVDAKQADFLLAPNPKTDKLVKIHRAIVVRRTTVAGETLFAVCPPVKPDRRNATHEEIKSAIRKKGRRLLQKCFASGAISQQESRMSDAELDAAFQRPEAFIAKLPAVKWRAGWVEVSVMWWSNILGFHRLSANAGKFMREADHSTGLQVSGFTKRGESNSSKLEQLKYALDPEGSLINVDDGRVAVANHRATFWNGAWDYSTGADPNTEGDQDDLGQDAHEPGNDESEEDCGGDEDGTE